MLKVINTVDKKLIGVGRNQSVILDSEHRYAVKVDGEVARIGFGIQIIAVDGKTKYVPRIVVEAANTEPFFDENGTITVGLLEAIKPLAEVVEKKPKNFVSAKDKVSDYGKAYTTVTINVVDEVEIAEDITSSVVLFMSVSVFHNLSKSPAKKDLNAEAITNKFNKRISGVKVSLFMKVNTFAVLGELKPTVQEIDLDMSDMS